jgi:phosphoribosylanthranilate isomerase
VKISESGLSETETVIQLKKEGFHGFLMGENFMKTREPEKALREFMAKLSRPKERLREDSEERQGENSELSSKIKVCGLKHPHNIKELSTLPIDMIGLIFYEKSPRYAGNLDAKTLRTLLDSIQKVGVFVNESKLNILAKIKQYDLQLIQLHGNESPGFCQELKSCGIKIIKAFPIREAGDLTASLSYENACDYFLFDTKTSQFGGSGEKFDWKILASYTGKTPFFLSGGIGIEDAETIRQIKHPLLYAIDLNSKFETVPGLKDVNKLRKFTLRVKNQELII